MKQNDKKLKEKLRSKIQEKQIIRSTKKQKDQILDDTLKSLGMDKEKFLKELKKNGLSNKLYK